MKLKSKIILAFVSVVLIYSGIQSYIMTQQTKEAFKSYLNKEDIQKLVKYERFFEKVIKANGIQSLEGKKIQLRPEALNKRLPSVIEANLEDVHITDNNKTIIASNDEDRIGQKVPDQASVFLRKLTVNGKDYGFVWLETKRSGLFTEIESSFLTGVKRASFLSLIIGLTVALLISLYFAKKVTEPLQQLTSSVRTFSSDFSKKPKPLHTNDEFEVLSQSFIQLLNKIDHNEKIRKQLVADVAHELRTPLTVLMNRFESIQHGIIEPDEVQIAKMYDEVFRLTRLVNDLQELSLADAGQLPLHLKNVNLPSLMEEILDAMKPLADEKSLSFATSFGDEPIYVMVDPDRIKQIIVNILGNAIRHSPSSSKITINISCNEELQLSIKDEGEGIAEKDLPFVFERFYQKDTARTRGASGGAGLGLSIAKGFAEAHGGKLSVTSQLGQGSQFTLTLPKHTSIN